MTITAIPESIGRIQHIASGGERTFLFDFPIYEESYIEVYETDTINNTRELTLSSDYDVIGVGIQPGNGEVAIQLSNSSYPNGAIKDYIYTLVLSVPIQRHSHFQQSGDLFAETVNREFNLLVQMVQRLDSKLNRAVLFPVESSESNIALPASPTANSVLTWGTSGDIVNGPTTTEISNAETHASNAQASATSAQVSANDAEQQKDTAEGHATTAENHAITASRWANEEEDTHVIDQDTGANTDQYSAKHWAKKAEQEVTNTPEDIYKVKSYAMDPEPGWLEQKIYCDTNSGMVCTREEDPDPNSDNFVGEVLSFEIRDNERFQSGMIIASVGNPQVGLSSTNIWLKCDGGEVSRSTYSILFSVIGTIFGPGDGTNTFNVPNLTQNGIANSLPIDYYIRT